MSLPAEIDSGKFDNYFRTQPDLWLDEIKQVCISNNLIPGKLNPFSDGSNLVASVNNRFVVKVFPAFHRHQWESEHRFLQHLTGKLSFPIPELIAAGELENGWTYVIITLLHGISLEKTWPLYTLSEKAAVMKQIGSMMAEMHAVPVGSLITIRPVWNTFINTQLSAFYKRHIKLGMPDWFMNDVEQFVNNSLHLLAEPTTALLTGEYTPFNLLAESGKICGMIDFGDAMAGHNEYDLLGPCLFLAAGNSELIRALFYSYGFTAPQLTDVLRRRLMLLQVLHRYSNFNFQLRLPGWQQKATSIEQLAELIWPF